MKIALAVAALVAFAATPVYGAGVTTLTDGRTLFVASPTGAPRGVVVLIPGGDSQLRIGPDGSPKPSGNFVIRTRQLWIDAGFAIAYLSDPTDLREPIARLRPLGVPIVLVSTSRGTIVAAQNAASLGAAGPDQIVLTSPVTSGGPLTAEKRPGIPISLAEINVQPVSVPTLIVTNDGDTCGVSTPAGALALATRFTPPAPVVHVNSAQIRSAPCEAFSPHGYLGIEGDVVGKIIGWVKSNMAAGAPAAR